LGVRIAPKAGREEGITPSWTKPKERVKTEAMLLVPMIRLYDHGTTVIRSEVLEPRLDALELAINPHDGENLGVGDGKKVEIRWNGQVAQLEAVFSEHVPTGTALLGRSLGVPLQGPEPVEISPVK
jgi:predicted molibdopterin-dependent oxidoreductase YjgC